MTPSARNASSCSLVKPRDSKISSLFSAQIRSGLVIDAGGFLHLEGVTNDGQLLGSIGVLNRRGNLDEHLTHFHDVLIVGGLLAVINGRYRIPASR